MPTVQEIKSIKQYAKWEESALTDLETAINNLLLDDIEVKKRGVKRLLSQATRELGWNCLPVREWFLNPSNRQRYFSSLQWNMSPKLLSDLLRCFFFVCERMIDHPVWADLTPQPELEIQEYKSELHKLALVYIEHPSTDVRGDAGINLALLGDEKAWSVLEQVIKNKASWCSWLRLVLVRYATLSISRNQKDSIKFLMETVKVKTKNASVKRNANEIIEIIDDI